MDGHDLWEALPGPDRDRIDALVRSGRRFEAVRTLRTASGARLGDCMDAVAGRYRALGVPSAPPEPPEDTEALAERVRRLPGRAVRIETAWDGDTAGWFVLLLAVLADPPTAVVLARFRHGSDLRIFNGAVPPWPEAAAAGEAGRALADRLGLPFRPAGPEPG
ncbi:hypothetical protein [Allonocardiopsis opalescens]|nr:hypothetical protein [Allonocardiopsis opalescens]